MREYSFELIRNISYSQPNFMHSWLIKLFLCRKYAEMHVSPLLLPLPLSSAYDHSQNKFIDSNNSVSATFQNKTCVHVYFYLTIADTITCQSIELLSWLTLKTVLIWITTSSPRNLTLVCAGCFVNVIRH